MAYIIILEKKMFYDHGMHINNQTWSKCSKIRIYIYNIYINNLFGR